jgi:nuclear pore complex protein Nup93
LLTPIFRFWSKIEATISKDPRVANLGGIPQPINKVRAYIRVLTQRKALIIPNTKDVDMESLQKIANGEEADYCWVLIFFLLRCGLFTEAAQYVHDNQKAIRNLDRNFNKYLERYVADPDHRLPADLRQPIQSEYHAKTHINPQHQTDPYKIACYKIIGRCELSRKVLEHVTGDEADWVWLLFSLAREVNRLEETAGESFGLHQLQDLIKDVGQRYYAQGAESPGGYGSYFLLQILSGMFEPAVSWLYGHNHVAAVHVGIALSYYGLLRVSDLSPGELCKS